MMDVLKVKVGNKWVGIPSIRGETPDIGIGTVESGPIASATITGTPEDPVLNLVLPKGDVYLAYLEINDEMQLVMTCSDGYTQPDFELTNNMELEVLF